MFVLSLDYGYLLLSTDVLLLRFVRILRVIRLVRIVKLSKLNTIIEESAASAGRQWVTLVVAITKTAIMMLTTAHFLTCAWFYIGLNLGPELPSLSWVEIAQIAERPDAWQDAHVHGSSSFVYFSFPEFPVSPDASGTTCRTHSKVVTARHKAWFSDRRTWFSVTTTVGRYCTPSIPHSLVLVQTPIFSYPPVPAEPSGSISI